MGREVPGEQEQQPHCLRGQTLGAEGEAGACSSQVGNLPRARCNSRNGCSIGALGLSPVMGVPRGRYIQGLFPLPSGVLVRHRFTAYLRATRGRADSSGFTVTETLVAAVIAVILSAAVTSIVVASLNMVGRAQVNAVVGANTQEALVNFENLLRDANRLDSMSTTMVSFTYQRENACELHTYTLESDPDKADALRLKHEIRAGILRSGTSCTDIQEALVAGRIGEPETSFDAHGLGAASKFTFYSDNGVQVMVPGDIDWSAENSTPTCKIGSIALSVVKDIDPLGAQSTTTESIRAAIRSNALGFTC